MIITYKSKVKGRKDLAEYHAHKKKDVAEVKEWKAGKDDIWKKK